MKKSKATKAKINPIEKIMERIAELSTKMLPLTADGNPKAVNQNVCQIIASELGTNPKVQKDEIVVEMDGRPFGEMKLKTISAPLLEIHFQLATGEWKISDLTELPIDVDGTKSGDSAWKITQGGVELAIEKKDFTVRCTILVEGLFLNLSPVQSVRVIVNPPYYFGK